MYIQCVYLRMPLLMYVVEMYADHAAMSCQSNDLRDFHKDVETPASGVQGHGPQRKTLAAKTQIW